MMKNRIVLTLTFLTAFFYLSQAESKSKDQPLKIGYVKIEYIFNLLPDNKQLESDYKAFEKQLKNNLEKKLVELQGKAQLLEKGYETMSEPVKKQKEAELRQLQVTFQNLDMEAQESLANKHVELLKPIQVKIQKAVAAVAEENGYTHIFNSDIGGLSILVYAEENSDISDLVIKKLGITATKEADKKVAKKDTKK
jgi:outer membrane protein